MVKIKRKSKKPKPKSPVATSTLNKKQLAARRREVERQWQAVLQSLAIAVSLAAVISIVLLFVVKPKLALAGGCSIAVLLLSYQYPRYALWTFLIYLPFNGTITYWVGGGSPVFQIAKDAFYMPALIGLIQNCQKKRLPIIIPKSLGMSLTIVLSLALLTLIFVNGFMQLHPPPGDKPILQGILGLKVLIGYIPLIPCAYYLIRHQKDLLVFTRMHLLLAIICCILGLAQYFMLVHGSCPGTRGKVGEDLFKATLTAKCLVGGSLVYSPEVNFIRLPGTFVAPWQWAWFLISNAFLTFVCTFFDPSFLWRMVGLSGLALVFVNGVISGQRAALILVPIVVGFLLVLTGQLVNFKRFIPIGVALGLLLFVGAATNPMVVQQRWESFLSRWNASPPEQFFMNQFQQSQNFISDSPLGKGIGRATNSTRVFGYTKLIETYQPKLLYELGYPGMLAFQGLLLQLTFFTFRAYRSVRDRSLRSYGASFWVFIAFFSINPQYYPLDVDPVAVYYWVLAGIILKLPKIDRQLQEEKSKALESNELLGQNFHKKKNLTSSPI